MNLWLEGFSEEVFTNQGGLRDAYFADVKRKISESSTLIRDVAFISISEEWYARLASPRDSLRTWTIVQGLGYFEGRDVLRGWLEQIIASLHQTFPRIPVTFVENWWTPGDVPAGLDVLGLDAYFVPTSPSCDDEQRWRFDDEVTHAYRDATALGKPILMVGGAFEGHIWKMPSVCQLGWYVDLARSTPQVIGVDWETWGNPTDPRGSITVEFRGIRDPGFTVQRQYLDQVGRDVVSSSPVRLQFRPRGASDFDGDGAANITTWRPSEGNWYIAGIGVYQWGVAGDVPVDGDFDGDRKGDVAVYRPSNGHWYVRRSGSGFSYADYQDIGFGLANAIPVPEDFDGDGKTDVAFFLPETGTWYLAISSWNPLRPDPTPWYAIATAAHQWGLPGDIPLGADFDGDGKADLAVFRPSEGNWYLRYSSSSYSYDTWRVFQWGLPGDIPISGDFDGDERADLAVYRPSEGNWYLLLSSSSYATAQAYQWGLPGDIPISGDYDGDGKTELMVFRPSNAHWYVRWSSDGYSYATANGYHFGATEDIVLSKK